LITGREDLGAKGATWIVFVPARSSAVTSRRNGRPMNPPAHSALTVTRPVVFFSSSGRCDEALGVGPSGGTITILL
jgi:hypothetical protein